jgi:hypothetical protein
MKKSYLYGIGALVILVGVFIFSQSGSSRPSARPAVNTTTTTTAARPSVSTSTSPTASASAQDIVPGLYPNPIKNTSTTKGISISSIVVENNTDAAGKAVSDHLQFTLQNLTTKTLSNPEVYYTITDSVNGKKEGYYKQLIGFTLAPHASGIVNFDGQSGYGHFAVNMRGIYGTVTDELKFAVEVSVSGYAPAQASATKAPGGAEVVGQ